MTQDAAFGSLSFPFHKMGQMTGATAGRHDGDGTGSHVESPWTCAWDEGSLQSALVIIAVIVFGEFMCSIIVC